MYKLAHLIAISIGLSINPHINGFFFGVSFLKGTVLAARRRREQQYRFGGVQNLAHGIHPLQRHAGVWRVVYTTYLYVRAELGFFCPAELPPCCQFIQSQRIFALFS